MWCVDYLAGARYQKEVLQAHKPGFGARVILAKEVFGDGLPLLKGLARKGTAPALGGHAIWDDRHTFGSKHLKIAIREAERLNDLAAKHPAIKWYFSPYLEHNLSASSMLKVMKEIERHSTNLILVNSPFKGAILPGYVNECHGEHGKPISGRYIWSADGDSIVDLDVEKLKQLHAKAELFCLWNSQLNLRMSDSDTTPRPQRRVRPSLKLIKSLNNLTNARGAVVLPDHYLWKSHAEQTSPTNDIRACKPVLIAPKKAKEALLVDSQGRVLARLPYYGKFTDGRHRYYSTRWGYEISSEPCKLVIGGDEVGAVNPGFRSGVFH